MMRLQTGFLTLVILISTSKSDALDCYTCTNATYVSECKTTKTCNAGEICFADYIQASPGILYSFGCRQETKCGTVVQKSSSVGSGSLVGRSGATGSCTECCREQHCNRHLCQHAFSEKECQDGAEINCVNVGAVLNMCSDIHHAIRVCRRFCGLCDYADGSWSSWLTWSTCEVSCGQGTRTRVRKCIEPAPSGGGLDCIGNAMETQSCTETPCPVHGAWSSWSGWGSCSATCGIGLQRRDRSCSNPFPALSGDHCFGDSRDDIVCLAGACSDGGWGDWTVWSTCSRTCGDGMKTRSRACDNPLPSIHGKYCQGDPYQVETCRPKDCAVTNGAWGSWSSWTTCTATCNGGMKSRYRDCSNPIPSAGGRLCTGSPYEVTGCNQQLCPRKQSAFTYTNPTAVKTYPFVGLRGQELCTARLSGCTDIGFTTRILQEGSYYDSSTGLFTCYYSGLYTFTATLINDNYVNCVIMKNDMPTVRIRGSLTTDEQATSSGTVSLHLNRNDKVGIFCHQPSSDIDSSSTFSGFLVNADP